MELKIDLLRSQAKSPYKKWLGVLFVIFGISWTILKLVMGEPVGFFDWIYSVVFILNGVIHLVEGTQGRTIDSYFGKAYVEVDSKLIRVKPRVFAKEQSISWTEISSLEERPASIIAIKTNGSLAHIDLSKLGYTVKSELKKAVAEVARYKKIPLT